MSIEGSTFPVRRHRHRRRAARRGRRRGGVGVRGDGLGTGRQMKARRQARRLPDHHGQAGRASPRARNARLTRPQPNALSQLKFFKKGVRKPRHGKDFLPPPHISYSCASPCGLALLILVTQDPFSDMRSENLMQRSSRNDVEYPGRGGPRGRHDRAGEPLLDHLVGAQQNRLRHHKSKRLGGLEVRPSRISPETAPGDRPASRRVECDRDKWRRHEWCLPDRLRRRANHRLSGRNRALSATADQARRSRTGWKKSGQNGHSSERYSAKRANRTPHPRRSGAQSPGLSRGPPKLMGPGRSLPILRSDEMTHGRAHLRRSNDLSRLAGGRHRRQTGAKQ
jgi:hypothetical protein